MIGFRFMRVILLVLTFLLAPKSVGSLVRFTSFLDHLHWPSGSVDMGHFGVFPFGNSYPL